MSNQDDTDLSSASQGLSVESSRTSPSKDRKRPKQQQRQLLSCSKCRERKVKCDRTKPCSACCARGHPRDCHFVLTEGSSFGPIQQSLELRKLRAENQRLKEQLLEVRSGASLDTEDDKSGTGPSTHTLKSAQRKLGLEEPGESIYFGNPSMVNVVSEIKTAGDSKTSFSLSHPVQSSITNLLVGTPTVYPFPTIWTTGTWLQGLRSCLEPEEDILNLVDSYNEREDSILTPRFTFGMGRTEVEKFMATFEQNATSFPDTLGLLFAILATELQRIKYDARQDEMDIDKQFDDVKSQMFSSASMQALRQSSFASQPTLRNVQATTLISMYLANSGRVLDAWTLLGTTIRNAQALGLHRNPKLIDPLPSLKDSAFRKKLWWYLLFIDQQFSMTLGRPMGISAIGDCPFAEPLTTDAAVLRLSECIDQLAILGRQIMGASPLASHRINGYLEKLKMVLDMLPDEVQFSREWMSDPSQKPDSPLDEYSAVIYCNIHSYLIILHRQRKDVSTVNANGSFSTNSTASGQTSLDTGLASPEFTATMTWSQMIASAKLILDVFHYLHTHHPASMVDWTIKHQAYTATNLLLTDASARHRFDHEHTIETAVAIFQDLAETKHDDLGRRAFDKLSEGLQQMRMADQRRRSSATSASLPEHTIPAQDVRRDSQISSTAAQSYGANVAEHQYKSAHISDNGPGFVEHYQPPPMSTYDQYMTQQPTAGQQRRASMTYGATYPSIPAEIPRPATGMAAPDHLYHSSFVPPPVSYRHSMHIGAMVPQSYMSGPLAPGQSYAPGMIPLQPGEPIPMEIHQPGPEHQLYIPQSSGEHHLQQYPNQQPQAMHYLPQQVQYTNQQAPAAYSQPEGRPHSHSMSSQPGDQGPWQ
ncbi:fungal-specific transcription factor domain-containing protein [Elsinoe ampelina]|uniref:Fungal-specific transcription factor domain-containing protein n=1 Tax=Elsinoe ampelina TaxID=302913 RepID=A0A6A6GGA3_9PEZI|nr:fungal-specific transcription factor domain-containing protein [Elsinoe ampelina]